VTNSDGVNSVNGVSDVPKEWAIAPPKSVFTTQELLETELADKPESENDEAVSISVENPQAATQENPRIAMYAAGIAVLFLLFSSTGNAAALLEEAESGTLDRILVSQAGLFHIVTGKWLGILLLGCLQITVMFVWAELFFKIQLAKHIVGFCIMTFSTAAATASFAMLLATLCKSRAQLNAVSVVIILSMSAVGGSMIPRFAMSDRMKEIGRWTFNAWALDGYQKIFWFQSPLTSLQNEVAVLLGSSLVLGVLTLLFSGRWKRG
jgi:ABC-2 type transport system permease protein